MATVERVQFGSVLLFTESESLEINALSITADDILAVVC